MTQGTAKAGIEPGARSEGSNFGRQTREQTAQRLGPMALQGEEVLERGDDLLDDLPVAGGPAAGRLGPRASGLGVGRSGHDRAIGLLPMPFPGDCVNHAHRHAKRVGHTHRHTGSQRYRDAHRHANRDEHNQWRPHQPDGDALRQVHHHADHHIHPDRKRNAHADVDARTVTYVHAEAHIDVRTVIPAYGTRTRGAGHHCTRAHPERDAVLASYERYRIADHNAESGHDVQAATSMAYAAAGLSAHASAWRIA